MTSDSFINLLRALIRQPSVVGAEHSFFRVLQRELEERGAKVDWYQGLLVARGTDPTSAIFSAHIDRHGLICTGPNEFQYAAFVCGNRSDLLDTSVSREMMMKIMDRYKSNQVMAYEPWSGVYRGSGIVRDSYICEYRNNVIFDVEGLEGVVAGTPVAFTDQLKIENNILSAQLDNVFSATHLVHLFDFGFQGTALFTAQEESGSSWRFLLEWFRRFYGSTEQLIVLDTSPYPDRINADQQEIVLRHRDANAEFDINTTHKIEKVCASRQIRYAYKDSYIEQQNSLAEEQGLEPQTLGSTELGRIISSSNGYVTGATLQVPTTGYHTTEESCSLESSNAYHRVLLELSGLT